MMSHLIFDLREAGRALRRDAGYAATVIVTLALTIGATTAVFSIVDGVLLKPLAYRESRQLVFIREIWRQFSQRFPTVPVNERHFEYWRQHALSFDSMAQYIALPGNLTGAGDAVQITVVHASGSLFEVLQVKPAIGRPMTPADERDDSLEVVVITDALWRQRLGRDPRVIGRSIVVDGTPHNIVGVLDAGFQLAAPGRMIDKVDAFVPIKMGHEHVGWAGDHNNAAIGRLKTGVTLEQARAELDVLQSQASEIATREEHEPVTLATSVAPLAEAVAGAARRGLLLLLAAIAAVLLIACSNLANLSLTRTASRLRDAAIRAALGASQGRLITRVVLEQLVLASAGGMLGMLVARAALVGFVRTAPIDLPRVGDVALDLRIFAFAAAVSIVAGLLVAMLPAWWAAHATVQPVLRASGIATTAGRGALRTRAALLALQVGLSVILLVVTALLSVSFLHLMNVDRGFTADRVLAVDVALPAIRYASVPARLATYDRLLAAVHSLPGVDSVATTSMLPLAGQGQVNFIVADGERRSRSERLTANFRLVSPEFFRTLGVPVQRGRAFADGERDENRAAPALVSERTALQLWPGEAPLGKRFSRGDPDEQGFEVVGVVSDARTTSLEAPPPLMVYAPYWWQSRTSTSLLIKTAVDPAFLIPSVRHAVGEIDPEIAIGQSRPLEALVERAFASRRYQMELFVAFGLVALTIAIIGIYATTAYGVSRRRREMNIRVALGAQTTQVIGLIVRQGSAPVLTGTLAGAVGAVAVGGIVASLLFDVRARDPLVISGVVGLVGGIGLLACVVAARQGLQIDLAAALRDE
jgi:predicted permease